MKRTSKTPELFTYDLDGNMTSDGRFHYTWNGENRLVCASNAEVVVTYAYDHRGRMVRKEISHRGTEARRIEYLWDDWNIIRETVREGDSVAVTDNVWGLDLDGTLQGAGGVGGLLAVVRSNSNSDSNSNLSLYFPTYDANGNVSEYVTTNGEIVAHYDYSPFGEPLVASGPLAASFTHQFSTKPYCAVTGFSEYQMRKYRPEIGRWMSRDPGEEESGVGLNVFEHNAVFNTYDYLGLDDGERFNGPGTGIIIRGILEHESYLVFEISCPKCQKATSIRVGGIRQAIACIASNEVLRVHNPSPNPRSKHPIISPIPNPDPRKRPRPQLDYDEQIAKFIHHWERAGVSDLKNANGEGNIEVNCEGRSIELRATMRTRFAGLLFGTQENAECYKKGIAIGYKCSPCSAGE